MEYSEDSCHFSKGEQSRVAIVLSCPGRYELDKGYPAAGATGTILKLLLQELEMRLGRNDLNRKNITITNAWPNVEFHERTRRSEASNSEVLELQNIERLNGQLGGISEIIIFCGDRANTVRMSKDLRLRKGVKTVGINHLGMRSLNQITVDVNSRKITSADNHIAIGDKRPKSEIQKENTLRRVLVIAEQVLQQLEL